MFIDFFFALRHQKIPVGIGEFLIFLEALKKGIAAGSMDDFYHLSKALLVKSEHNFDAFDRVFSQQFKGVELPDITKHEIDREWIEDRLFREFTEEEKALIEAMGGMDQLMERLNQLLEEQKERHQGGNKWIGTGGTSPFGNGGYNPEGIRFGGQGGGRSAVKVWEKRVFKDLSDEVELNTRNIKVALRRLRHFTREGIQEELDLDQTIRKTTENAGYLDLVMRAEKRNNIKVLIFFDVGGSMDVHVETCEQLFSAAKSEFKHLEYYYFHNCIYENVWKDNSLRWSEGISIPSIINKYNSDYRLIIVGDASMAMHELMTPGGSIDDHSGGRGIDWISKLTGHFKSHIWLNPEPEAYWGFTESILTIREAAVERRMYPMTIGGLTEGMKALHKHKEKEKYTIQQLDKKYNGV